MRARQVIALLLPAVMAGCSTHPTNTTVTAAAGKTEIGAWGLDLSARDSSVKPGDDFYRFADGRWLDSNQIPSDRTSWNSFDILTDAAERNVRTILDKLPADAPEGSNERKVGDYYRAYLDTESIERLGLAPAQPALEAIASARTYDQLAQLMGRPDFSLKSPLGVFVGTDPKDPDRYIVTI